MRLTYIKSDNLVVVDGLALQKEFELKYFKKDDIWAIQNSLGETNIEFEFQINEEMHAYVQENAQKEVDNLYTQWKALFDEKEAERIEAERIACLTEKEKFTEGLITQEEYSNYIKSIRDEILSGMDKYSIMYQEGVITDEQYEKVKKHKDYLRGIPQTKGFPKTFTEFEEFTL